MKKIITFIKKETVLTVAWLLAVISMFFVAPNREYISYIDFKSLGILWSLMVIMAGLKSIYFFEKVGQKLLKRAKNPFMLSFILVFLCFFSSMFITNDVALLTFVPFAIYILEASDKCELLIPVIVLQTLAANLGSMMTPIGNPQNLYLYAISGMDALSFAKLMLPYTSITFGLLILSIVIFFRKETTDNSDNIKLTTNRLSYKKLFVYMLLFILALLVVGRVVSHYYLIAAVFVTLLIMDKKILLSIDYALLFTFVGFFIFTGNLGKLPVINQFLTNLVKGREIFTGVLASQFISNVPAALLLSDFTTDYRRLILGVNLGGLGTLIASMASLISFKLLAHSHNELKGKYLKLFTIMNIIYLIILALLAHLLSA